MGESDVKMGILWLEFSPGANMYLLTSQLPAARVISVNMTFLRESESVSFLNLKNIICTFCYSKISLNTRDWST